MKIDCVESFFRGSRNIDLAFGFDQVRGRRWRAGGTRDERGIHADARLAATLSVFRSRPTDGLSIRSQCGHPWRAARVGTGSVS